MLVTFVIKNLTIHFL